MWSGKFKNGESFNDLSDAEIEKFSSEIDESSVKEIQGSDVISDRVTSSPMSQDELSKFLSSNPDLAGYDTYKKDPNAGRSANPTDVKTPTIISTTKDMLGDYFTHLPFINDEGYVIQPKAKEGLSSTANYVRENPGKSVAIAGSFAMPLTAMGLLGAGLIGASGEAVDKFNPTTDAPSEYSTKKTVDNVTDVLGGGLVNMIGHGLGIGVNKAIGGVIAPTIARDKLIKETIEANTKNEELLTHLGIRGGVNGAGEGMGAPSYIRAKISDMIRKEQPDVVNAFRELPRTTDDLAGVGDEISFARVLREDAKTPINTLEINQAINRNRAIDLANTHNTRLGKPLVDKVTVPEPKYMTANVEIPDYEIAKRYAELKIPKEVPARQGINILPNTIYSNAPDIIREANMVKNNLMIPDILHTIEPLAGRTSQMVSTTGGNLIRSLIKRDR